MKSVFVFARIALVALSLAVTGLAEAPIGDKSAGDASPDTTVVKTAEGNFTITINTSETPDLTSWAKNDLAPVVKEWYPRLVAMLPSKDYQAPTEVKIDFSKDMKGVAATGGGHIRCAAKWFRENLNGEAKGAVVHELIHVIQDYGKARRDHPDGTRPPGWLVESIADYLRWYKYEPQSHGAEITKKNFSRAKYDGNYRISANFLNWASESFDKDLVSHLNAAIREGYYGEEAWKKNTGHSVEELGKLWKEALAVKLGIPPEEANPAKPADDGEKKNP